MYQWLRAALSPLLAAARRPAPPPAPAPAPAPPPPRKRSLRRAKPPLEDSDQTRPKKQKSGYAVSEPTEKVEEVSAVAKLPAEETNEHGKASVSNAAPITEPTDETQSTSSGRLSKTPASAALEVEILQIDKMPCGTSTCLNNETLSLSHKTIPYLSTSRNGNHHIKPTPGDTVTLRPPIKEHTMPEPATSEVGKMGRPFSTVEEDVLRGEKEKYKQILKLVKEKYPRSRSISQPTSFCNVQAYSKEPVTAASHLEEQKCGDVSQYTTLRTNCCSTHRSPRGDMIRYYTPEENSREQGRPVKQASSGRQRGAQISEEVSFRLCLAPVLSKRASVLDVEEKKFPRSEKRVERFAPLTEDMEREITAALGEGKPDDIMSSAFKLKVTREDIHTLKNFYWLNDEIINFYMNLLVERNKKEGYPAVYAFSTFFYPKLTSGGYKAVRRWTRGVDLFKQDLIVVPIHLTMHWALAVIDVRRKTIMYFDSMAQKGDKICEALFQYLQEESQEKRNLELSFSEWILRNMEPHEIPQQTNGSDCGVFLCKYADYISRDKPITFTQNHMPYFRRKMVWEIIHQQLL
ncbi:sentrin-specific protease 2 isoform X2 [Oxyura jamaicensis]|uniref:sentrin-specific protease 2 isoform X2 n=1 Tax=Oxyura jamaicensis TaxID=8884 RepID=UPI0015A6FFD8|nr:sentrin-specific protease 2 isoform X2 [Oxyura jamaicensis]